MLLRFLTVANKEIWTAYGLVLWVTVWAKKMLYAIGFVHLKLAKKIEQRLLTNEASYSFLCEFMFFAHFHIMN